MFVTAILCFAAIPQTSQVPADVLPEKISTFKKLVKERDVENLLVSHLDGFLTIYTTGLERIREIDEELDLGSENKKELAKERKQLDKRLDSICDTVWKVFSRKKETKANMDLWTAAIFTFGRMQLHGSEFLWKAFEDKRFNRDVAFRSLCVEHIGFTLDYEQVDELLDLLDYKDEQVAASAGTALSHFGEMPGAKRKEATKGLTKSMESYHNASLIYEDTNAVRRYRAIRGPFLQALTAMTNQSFRDPLEWTRWWNKNKKSKDEWRDI